MKILSIDRSDRNHIKVNASIKQAGENPYEKALRRYTVGNRYGGNGQHGRYERCIRFPRRRH